MTKPVKKNDYLFPFPRLFTRVEGDAYDTIGFQSSESFGDESAPALASPLNWTNEAVAMMAEAACASIPADLRAARPKAICAISSTASQVPPPRKPGNWGCLPAKNMRALFTTNPVLL